MTNETTCLLPTTTTATAAIITTTTATAGGDDAYSVDYESSYHAGTHRDSTNHHVCNTFQTENNNKYAYGSLVMVRPWSSESDDSDGGDDEKEYCKTKPMTSKKSLVVKTCLFLLLACIFWRFSSNSNVVSEQQQTKDFTTKQPLGKSTHHGSSSLLQKNRNKMKDLNHKNNNDIQNDDLSMDDFLQERQAHPTRHFVIGNKAGDADSVVSALTLAYIESYAAMDVFQNENDSQKKTPIASITRADFQTQRPDIFLLFQWAGISSNHVLFVDDIPSLVVNVEKTTAAVNNVNDDRVVVDVTLTDHNVMDIDMPSSWSVVEIVDHHVDQGQHVDTCTGDSRMIAFEQKKALVASTCSLVAERLQQVWRAVAHGDDNNKGKRRRSRTRTAITVPEPLHYYYPASVSLLLLGVILIDSMNLSPHANAATLRDVNAVQDLLEHTHWRDLPLETQNQLGISSSTNNNSPTTATAKPNTTLIFNKLQDAKYNPDFWKSLSVRDALRLDYKDYKYGDNDDDDLDSTDAVDGHGQKASGGGGVFGISSIRIPIKDFLANKQDLVTDIINYMVNDAHIDFLAIMPVFVDENGQYLKQLVLINRNHGENNAAAPPPPPFFDKLKLYLLQQESLGLQQIQVNQKTVGLHQKQAAENNNVEDSTTNPNNDGIVLLSDDNLPDQSISLVFFNQLKIQPSRKQIGPILRTFFDNNNNIESEQ